MVEEKESSLGVGTIQRGGGQGHRKAPCLKEAVAPEIQQQMSPRSVRPGFPGFQNFFFFKGMEL